MILEDLFTKYGTDKGIWGYTPVYEQFLNHWREQVKDVLEIGICGDRDIPNNRTGASLFAWRDYFPNARIVGIDNDAKWMVTGEERIETYCLDAYDMTALTTLLVKLDRTYDFICDDAVHDPIPQLTLLHTVWPFLRPTGIAAVEDVCPYKVPHNDLTHMIRHFPRDAVTKEFETHKAERLLIVQKTISLTEH